MHFILQIILGDKDTNYLPNMQEKGKIWYKIN